MIARFGRLALLLCLSLAACGDLPEPFLGNPGATARRLAQPLTPVLAIPPGTDTLLPDAANQELAKQVAAALVATEVPAIVRTPEKNDWRVITKAQQQGDSVTPVFSVQDPKGKEEGSAEGEKVPLHAWANPNPALLEQIAAEAGPRIGAVLTSIRIAHDKADPHSLYNRQAKVLVSDVTGAPGDGDDALTRQMRARLAVLGPIVLTTPTGADFVVQGQVKVVPIPKGQERVEIQWIVKTASGDERGRVVQLNNIPAGTLDHYWGDVAVVVASEASNGVNDVVLRQSGHDPNAARSGATAPATTKPDDVKPSGVTPAATGK
ncbi:MAG TPA: hypothetical protein VGM42_13655 [Rhodopila sp.]|jgi:hypothetical protein